jgi:hypothetical protein
MFNSPIMLSSETVDFDRVGKMARPTDRPAWTLTAGFISGLPALLSRTCKTVWRSSKSRAVLRSPLAD